MRKKKYLLIALVLVGIFLLAFISFKPQVTPIASDHTYQLEVTDMNDGSGDIRFKVATTHQYGCLGFSIQTDLDYNKQDQVITMSLNGITEPQGSACPTALGPAIGQEVQSLEDGTYTLELVTQHASDAYSLVVDRTDITIEPIDVPSFSNVELNTTSRAPDNLMRVMCIHFPKVENEPSPCPTIDDILLSIATPLPDIQLPHQRAVDDYYIYKGSDDALEDLVKEYGPQNINLYIERIGGNKFHCANKGSEGFICGKAPL